jgi:hypothetical protein
MAKAESHEAREKLENKFISRVLILLCRSRVPQKLDEISVSFDVECACDDVLIALKVFI